MGSWWWLRYDTGGALVSKINNEVIVFMEREHRKPSKYYQEEKLKFHFIHHNKKLYNAGASKAEREQTFEKLLAPCEKYKIVNNYV